MKNPVYPLLFIYLIVEAITIVFFDGTGDTGDSITHFLFAKYAPQHPELYFDHWAKPVFVLLASPFAQFGFVGIKCFNALASFFTIFLTYKIAEKLKYRNSAVVPLLLIFTPLYFIMTFSGLTEPLFAFVLTLGSYLLISERFFLACLFISFLPFVRSEGLIVIGVVGLFLLVKREWKMIPVLLIGHLIYSFAGFFVHHDLLWVFRKIPYAHMSSIYGHGELTHFASKLFYFLGLPFYILFCLGLITMVFDAVRKKIESSELFLILVLFLAFFIAHSLFWYFGIFGSMGLIRVFICVIPVMALIALNGFNFLTEFLPEKMKFPKFVLKFLLVAFIMIFPFTSNHAALHINHDLNLKTDQRLCFEIANYILKNETAEHRTIYSHPYLGLALEIDPFNANQKMELNRDVFTHLKAGDLLIWDNWFSVTEANIQKNELDSNIELIHLKDFTSTENQQKCSFSVYRKK